MENATEFKKHLEEMVTLVQNLKWMQTDKMVSPTELYNYNDRTLRNIVGVAQLLKDANYEIHRKAVVV